MTVAAAFTTYSLGVNADDELECTSSAKCNPFLSPKPSAHRFAKALMGAVLESPRGSDELFAESLFENWTKTQADGALRGVGLNRRKHEYDARTSSLTSRVSQNIKHESDVAPPKRHQAQSKTKASHTFLRAERASETCWHEIHESNRRVPSGFESVRGTATTTSTMSSATTTAHFPKSRNPSNAFSTSPVINRSSPSTTNHSTTMAHPRDSSLSPILSKDPRMKAPPSKRSRSRAIPIKRHPSMDQDDSTWSHPNGDDAEMERMYDWATWRLYHRIVEHREKYPLTASYFNDSDPSSSSPDASSSAAARLCAHALQGADSQGRLASVNFEPSTLEGEVFDFEL